MIVRNGIVVGIRPVDQRAYAPMAYVSAQHIRIGSLRKRINALYAAAMALGI